MDGFSLGGRGNVYCGRSLELPLQLRGGSSVTQKVQSWSTHTALLFCQGTVVSSSCAAVSEGWVHGKYIQQTIKTKEHSLQISLGEMADDLAWYATHNTPCWQAIQVQLQPATQQTDALSVSVRACVYEWVCVLHEWSCICVHVCFVLMRLFASTYQHCNWLWTQALWFISENTVWSTEQ